MQTTSVLNFPKALGQTFAIFVAASTLSLAWPLHVWGSQECRALFENHSTGSPLKTLDEIVAQHGDISSFLRNSESQLRYRLALENLIEDGTPRTLSEREFSNLLEQLRTAIEKTKGIKDALLRSYPGSTHRLHTRHGFSGMNLDHEAWETYVRSQIIETAPDAKFDFQAWTVRLESISQTLGGDTRKNQRLFAKEINAFWFNDETQFWLASLYSQYMSRILSKNVTSADQALETLNESSLKSFAQSHQSLSNEGVKVLYSLLKRKLPSHKELTAMDSVFTPLTNFDTGFGSNLPASPTMPGTYELVPLSKGIHSVFKAFYGAGNECVGGTCAMYTTPARWATGLIPGARVYALLHNGRLAGYLQSVPVRQKSTGSQFTNLEFHSPHFYSQIYPNHQAFETARPIFLLDWAYSEVQKDFSPDTVFVMSKYSELNRSIGPAAESPIFKKARLVARDGRDFEVAVTSEIEPLKRQLEKYRNRYSDGTEFMVDATYSNSVLYRLPR